MKKHTRDDAVDAAIILNDFVGDITSGVVVLMHYRARLLNDSDSRHALTAVQKMCLSHLILTLYKWLEFYEKYHNLFEDQLKEQCKQLTTRIKKRNVINFRHKCIGHIWDNDKNRPVYNSEIHAYLNKIMLNDTNEFLCWLHNPDGNKYPNSVVSIIEKCRNDIAKTHGIEYSEILQK